MNSNFEHNHDEFVTDPIAKISTQTPADFAPNLNQGMVIMQNFVQEMLQARRDQESDENISQGFILPDEEELEENIPLSDLEGILSDPSVFEQYGEYFVDKVYSNRGQAYSAYGELYMIFTGLNN